jgi:diphthine synthase
LEYYTSVLGVKKEKLEEFYGVSITLADRNMVESDPNSEDAVSNSENETIGGLIYLEAKEKNIGFLVVGDALCATTHIDLILRARKIGVTVEVIHNASVMSASASCGLPLYQFGYTVSIPFFDESWRPQSFYDRIRYNKDGGMHTLCLLDIKVKEPDFEALFKGKVKFLPPRFMTVNIAIKQLLEVEEMRGEVCLKLYINMISNVYAQIVFFLFFSLVLLLSFFVLESNNIRIVCSRYGSTWTENATSM